MDYVRLGSTGIQISRMGLGCMGMSEYRGPAEKSECLATIDAALSEGINFFDTADVYGAGSNEQLVGEALSGRRNSVVLATKCGFVRSDDPTKLGINGDPRYVIDSCEQSLRRLGTDYIDLYYLHRPDPKVPIEETMGAMASLVSTGKIRAVGLCEVPADTLRRAARVHPISALQSNYSLWHQSIAKNEIPTCLELNVTVVPFSPLGRGLLAGRINRTDDLAIDDTRRILPEFQGDTLKRHLAVVEKVKAIAVARHATSSQVALAWMLAQGNHIVPIPGTKRPRYLLENARAIQVQLSKEDLVSLGSLADHLLQAGKMTA